MQISEYQRWLEEFDRARGWQQVSPSHTLLHALEEIGEVARLVLYLEGYKGGKRPDDVRQELAAELSDLFVFLFKLAYQNRIDMEQALLAGQAKAEARHGDLNEARAELDRYVVQQAANREHLALNGAPEQKQERSQAGPLVDDGKAGRGSGGAG